MSVGFQYCGQVGVEGFRYTDEFVTDRFSGAARRLVAKWGGRAIVSLGLRIKEFVDCLSSCSMDNRWAHVSGGPIPAGGAEGVCRKTSVAGA